VVTARVMHRANAVLHARLQLLVAESPRRDAKYLYPIDRLFNVNSKGVVHFNGNVGVSGTLNGRITPYANGSIILLDDLRYANDR
jgi:hypothetical protein